jgi:hypothetical protein
MSKIDNIVTGRNFVCYQRVMGLNFVTRNECVKSKSNPCIIYRDIALKKITEEQTQF